MARITLVTGAAGGLGQSVAARLAAFIGALRDAKCPGSGVLVSSAAARIGTPNHETVAAAKAGVEGLVRSAAATSAGNGIRINAVAPGIMGTPAAAAILSSAMGREAAARQYPLPGIGSADALLRLERRPGASRLVGISVSADAGEFSSGIRVSGPLLAR